jgi:hypothetical protein
MHRFSLERYAYEQDGGWPTTRETVDLVVPVIDGVPLFEIVEAHYPGLAIEHVAAPSHEWLGQPTYGDDGGRAVVIDGSCGVAGCCGVLADIVVSTNVVTWTGLFSRAVDTALETFAFLFDRGEYERAIANVRDLPARPVRAPDELPSTARTVDDADEAVQLAPPIPVTAGGRPDKPVGKVVFEIRGGRRELQRMNRKRKKKDRDPRYVVGKPGLRRYVKRLEAATVDGPVRFEGEHDGLRLTMLHPDGDFSVVIPWFQLVRAKPSTWSEVVGDAEMELINRRHWLTRGQTDVVRNSFLIVAPIDGPAEPIELQASRTDSSGKLIFSSAVASWPGAVSLSWRYQPNTWSHVLAVANQLGAPPFDGDEPSRTIEAVTVPGLLAPYIIGTQLPRLGVTMLELHGLSHTAVLIAAGCLDPPKQVRLFAVEDANTLDAFGDPLARLRSVM